MSKSTSHLGLSLSLPTFTPQSLARTVATAFGLMATIFGTHSILDPASYALQFGFPPTSPASLSAASNPFIPVAGGRALASGLTALALLALGHDRAVGVVFVCGGVMGVVDGLVLVRYRDGDEGAWRKAWEHFLTVGVSSLVGGWMVGNCTN